MRFAYKTISLLIIFFIIAPHFSLANAEQNSTIVDCIENRDKCKQDEPKKDEKVKQPAVGAPEFTAMDFVKTFLAFAFVIGLLILVLKIIAKRNQQFQKQRVLQNLGGIPLGANKSIQLVRIGSKLFVVGVGENVQLLTEIEDDSLVEQLFNEANEAIADVPKHWLGRFFVKQPEKKAKQQFSTVLQQQLTELQTSRKKAVEDLSKEGLKRDE